MANKWVYLATVCSCTIATAFAATARSQEATEGAPAEHTAPSEATVTAAPPSESAVAVESVAVESVAVESVAAVTSAPSEGAPNQLPDVAASGNPAQALPAQTGGFVQRLSDRLNGANPVRVPIPAANRDPRADLLDTSFPAEQPEVAEAEPDLGSNSNMRRTQARTANGITELSNRADPIVESVSALSRVPSVKPTLSQPQVNTELNNPRLDSQLSLPTTSAPRNTSGTSPWLWVLAGTAALLLVPIAFLLTRPTR